MSLALVEHETRTNGHLDQMRAAKGEIESSDPKKLAQIIAFAEAVGIAARARAAADLAREAAETRIRALRRLGELIVSAPDEERREALWQFVPEGRGYGRCDELGEIPAKLFEKVLPRLIDGGAAITPYVVIRDAKIASLKSIERDIWIDYAGEYWISGGKRARQHVGLTIDEARTALRLKADPKRKKVDGLYSRARIFAQEIEQCKSGLSGRARDLVAEAELLQAKVAELLHQAYVA